RAARPGAGGRSAAVHDGSRGRGSDAGDRGSWHAGPVTETSPADVRRWRRHLADELAEAAVYRDLADRVRGEDREILLALADAEGRHAAHWQELLGERAGRLPRPGMRMRLLAALARRFGSVFVLALAQN